jgi:hypothetical protein
MQNLKRLFNPSRSSVAKTSMGLLLMFWIVGCGVSPGPGTAPATTAQQGPQNYFAPFVTGTTNNSGVYFLPQVYAIDDKADTFSQTTYVLQPPQQIYSQVLNAGEFSVAQRNLRSLGITANYVQGEIGGQSVYVAQTYNPPKAGSFAVELAGQTGGLVQLVGQPVAPLVAATQCPNQKTAQTYLFVTIPAGLSSTTPGGTPDRAWDPVTDTAYGSVDISSSGETVNFQNIRQFTLPSVGGTGVPSQPSSSSQTGICGPTSFGQITNVPGQLIVTTPGNTQTAPPQAKIGIGASSLLVEDNGVAEFNPSAGTSPSLYYNNVLGAGTGAVGLPKTLSAVDTGAVVGAQYLGFIYSPGIYTNALQLPTGWSSHLASFGGCPSIATSSSTLIYGGEFTNDDPSTSPDGFGNCNLAIDLGAQDASTNGLYPKATVTGATSSFSAVAIAGQLNGKYAIFLIGVDSTQPWGIYLLQSN